MDINIGQLAASEMLSLSNRLLDHGWTFTGQELTRYVYDVEIKITMSPRLLKYRQMCKAANEQSGMIKTVIIPWIGIELFTDEMNERTLFAAKSQILEALNLQPFKDSNAILDVFVLVSDKHVLYVNPDYPLGWEEINTL